MRAKLAKIIKKTARFSIQTIDVDVIDRVNILQATLIGMRQAIDALMGDFALIDGNQIPKELSIEAKSLVKGDAKSASIAAASIIAKDYRDQLMRDYAAQFPGYGWEKNAGYGTKMHKNAIQYLGVTPLHRQSFKPIYNMLRK